MQGLVLRDCSTCGEPRPFEMPLCADGHGADCPELACVDCGEAVVASAPGSELAGADQVRPHVAAAA